MLLRLRPTHLTKQWADARNRACGGFNSGLAAPLTAWSRDFDRFSLDLRLYSAIMFKRFAERRKCHAVRLQIVRPTRKNVEGGFRFINPTQARQ